jgi:hypothetical protein
MRKKTLPPNMGVRWMDAKIERKSTKKIWSAANKRLHLTKMRIESVN